MNPGSKVEAMAQILIVVNECRCAETTAEACRAEGHEAVVIRHATQAMLYVLRRRFDVVMVETGMPGKEGQALIQGLRAQPSCARLPVVALAPTGREDQARGADRVIGVPVEPEAVQEALRALNVPPAREVAHA